jgi:hypothetical protein
VVDSGWPFILRHLLPGTHVSRLWRGIRRPTAPTPASVFQHRRDTIATLDCTRNFIRLPGSNYSQNGFSGSVAITLSGLPSGLSATPLSFSVQNSSQIATLTAASTIATGNYSLSLNGTSGNSTGAATVDVGVGALANFGIIQPLFTQIVTRYYEGEKFLVNPLALTAAAELGARALRISDRSGGDPAWGPL